MDQNIEFRWHCIFWSRKASSSTKTTLVEANPTTYMWVVGILYQNMHHNKFRRWTKPCNLIPSSHATYRNMTKIARDIGAAPFYWEMDENDWHSKIYLKFLLLVLSVVYVRGLRASELLLKQGVRNTSEVWSQAFEAWGILPKVKFLWTLILWSWRSGLNKVEVSMKLTF